MPPLAPRNVFVLSPFELGAWDIRWDSPADLPGNASEIVLGANIYRSADGPAGPYTKLNTDPVAITHWRDQMGYVQITEDVTASFVTKGTDSAKRWEFRTKQRIQVRGMTGPEYARNPADVTVTVNGEPATVMSVDGYSRRVRLRTEPLFDPVAMKNEPVKLPGEGETVLCSYPVVDNNSHPLLSRRVYYKVTTVTTTGETPLEMVEAISPNQMEGVDYIWKEAVRRNSWILEQGGNRVKAFVRKWAGERCPTHEPVHGSSSKLCPVCYGTGYVGGYDGPYDMIIAPPQNEWRMQHQPIGIHNSKQYQSWAMVLGNPMLAPRDLVLMPNGERYIIGSVTFYDHRGVQLQQAFDLSLLDSNDVAYNVPVATPYGGNGGLNTGGGVTQASGPNAEPFPVTDHPKIEDHREDRGTTPNFGAIEF